MVYGLGYSFIRLFVLIQSQVKKKKPQRMLGFFFLLITLVRGGGLEPPHRYRRQDLNLVRLPISPPAQFRFLF
jgi:hypothetical protein